jgi:hypothetical protein
MVLVPSWPAVLSPQAPERAVSLDGQRVVRPGGQRAYPDRLVSCRSAAVGGAAIAQLAAVVVAPVFERARGGRPQREQLGRMAAASIRADADVDGGRRVGRIQVQDQPIR